MCVLHHHTEFSAYDGFGKPKELAVLAKELGHTALGISDHGNTNGLVQHYKACMEVGIKPILGVEGYFLPKYIEQHRGYHLCAFAKNPKGYHNLNALQTDGDKQRYYNPIWTFELLEKYHEGLIVTSACVASYSSQCIVKGELDKAKKYLKKMKAIMGDDFYIELQPYCVSEKSLQEKVNVALIKLSQELDIKCILTSDSHRGRKDEFDTYLKMHEMAGHDVEEISRTYKERYMPTDEELVQRFIKMHTKDFKTPEKCEKFARQCIKNLKEIEDKVVDDMFADFKQILPKISDDADKQLKHDIKAGLEKRGKWKKEYIDRIKQEYDVVVTLGYASYFLIVADYVNWAKEQGITVGCGRGSACNCLIAYALGITEVDSLLFGLDFRRFMRKDKTALFDIDVDFETARRQEVIDYIIEKYSGHTARVASYGLYKVDNLINDLAKVCGLPTDKNVDEEQKKLNEKEIKNIKALCGQFIDADANLDTDSMLANREVKMLNDRYDNIFVHFSKLYQKLKYIGTHAAGVAVTGGDILDYTALRIDSKTGDVYSNYDLNDIEAIGVIKFDILGLNTMEEIGELRKLTGVTVNYDEAVHDEEILDAFHRGDTQGIFQFDKRTVREMLQEIDCTTFDDIVAANAMNRPSALSTGMPEQYASNKSNVETAQELLYYDYTKESYGTIIYQEQVQQICVFLGGMEWTDADKVMKMDGSKAMSPEKREKFNQTKAELHDIFVKGAMKNGFKREQAEQIFASATDMYGFNKGHACGYSLLSVEEMFYKVHYPLYFWFGKIKYAPNEDVYYKCCALAAQAGNVVFLPHINYSDVKTRIRKVEGEPCLQQGLAEIKGVGEKAAIEIVAERKNNGVFTSWDNFYDRCKSRVVNAKVLKLLSECGASSFDKSEYISRVTKYNSTLMARDIR
jgi:DNA polymerase-3 subunit alpha